jgi:hypothetical protein
MAADTGSSTVIAGAIIMIALIGGIAFVFLLLVFIMSRFRTASLNRAIHKLIEDPKNDCLRATPRDLGRIYNAAAEIWERRARMIPIPELRRLPDGWIHAPDEKVINVRDEIAKSALRVCELAAQNGDRFVRAKWQTVAQLLDCLLREGVCALSRDTAERYLRYYDAARFESPKARFTQEAWDDFEGVFSQICAEITARPRG